jgi:hypothetical protein
MRCVEAVLRGAKRDFHEMAWHDAKIPSVGGFSFNLRRRFGRRVPALAIFSALKPHNSLKTLIQHERIQGNPNQKGPRQKSISRPNRGSPMKSK